MLQQGNVARVEPTAALLGAAYPHFPRISSRPRPGRGLLADARQSV